MSAMITTPMAGIPRVTFMTLPPEIRDQIYAQFPHYAFISINQKPVDVQQPNISRVSRQVRREALAIFYSRNHFVLDLRGWKDPSYPKLWRPADIFDAWIRAIGDTNAAHLRSLKIFAANFRLILKISREPPVKIDWTVKANTKTVDLADRLPLHYNFTVATDRVQSAFGLIVTDIQSTTRNEERHLTAADINRLKDAVANLQPFLCSRMCLGFKGAVLKADNMPEDQWPDITDHLEQCDDCLNYRSDAKEWRLRKMEECEREKIVQMMMEGWGIGLGLPKREKWLSKQVYWAAVDEGVRHHAERMRRRDARDAELEARMAVNYTPRRRY